MHELTVTTRKPTKNYPAGRHEWSGPLGTGKFIVSFDAADFSEGTVLRVEIIEGLDLTSPDESAAAAAAGSVEEQTPKG